MTVLTMTTGSFRITAPNGSLVFENRAGEAGVRFGGISITGPNGTGPNASAWGLRFRNRTETSVPNQKFLCAQIGQIVLPTPMGTATRAIKARAPDGSTWYLNVRTTAPT